MGTPYKLLRTDNVYFVFVNFEINVTKAISLGCYKWVNRIVKFKNIQNEQKGEAVIVVELIHFNRVISTKEALYQINKARYRPAEFYELLAFGEKYPDVQRQFPIVALGSICQNQDGGYYVPVLDGSDSDRFLDMEWIERNWSKNHRFIVIPED